MFWSNLRCSRCLKFFLNLFRILSEKQTAADFLNKIYRFLKEFQSYLRSEFELNRTKETAYILIREITFIGWNEKSNSQSPELSLVAYCQRSYQRWLDKRIYKTEIKVWAVLGSGGTPNCHKYKTFWGDFFNFLWAKKIIEI